MDVQKLLFPDAHFDFMLDKGIKFMQLKNWDIASPQSDRIIVAQDTSTL